MPEVGRDGHHFGGDHDLMLVEDGLGVVALQNPLGTYTFNTGRPAGQLRPLRAASAA
jgi:hypothetical protein